MQGLSFSTGYLQTTGTESNLQNEQVTQGRATFAESLVSITDGLGTRTEGGVVRRASRRLRPERARRNLRHDVRGRRDRGTVSSTSGSTSITFIAPPGDTGRADVAVVAGGANVCPPPTDLAETDALPVRRRSDAAGGNAVVASFHWAASCPSLGSATLASVAAAAGNPVKSFADREAVSGQDGRIEVTATRNFGVMGIGAFPSGITAPAGFNVSAADAGWVTRTRSTSQAGTTTTAAPSTGTPTGNVSFWNGAGYTSSARRPPGSTT